MSEAGHSLGTRTVRGMAWAYGAYVGGRLLVLAQTAILARLLTPADFGLVALALTFMVLLDSVKDLGLGQALIVGDPEQDEERAQTAFGWGVIVGLSLTAVTVVIAPLAAKFFHEDQLTALLPVFGATFFVRSLGATHYAIARKKLNYRVRTMSETAEVVVRGIVGISLALLGAGVWSLAIGFLCGTIVSTIALWLAVKFRPRRQLTSTHLRSMLKFGGTLTLVDIGAVFAYNLDYLFIGRVLGAAALGFYTIAFRLPELVVVNLAIVAGDVLFPAYAAADRERLREAYLTALRYTAMLTLPISMVLIVLAQPIILVLFGDQWGPSAVVMPILTVQALLATMDIPCGTVYKVTGQAHVLLWLTVPGITALVVLLLIFADDGIKAVAICGASVQAAGTLCTAVIASRRLKVPLFSNIKAIGSAVAAAAVMAAAMIPIERAIDKPFLAVLLGASAGFLAYGAVIYALSREDINRLRRMAFPSAG